MNMEEQFIEEVRKYDFLYNLQNKDYRDQRKRQEAWEEIGGKIKRNWQECRESWTKLRNAYTNALKRRTSSGQAAKKIMKWKFEEQMSFLAPHLEPRASQSNFHAQIEYDVERQSEGNDTYITDIVETQDKEYGGEDQVLNKSLNLLAEVTTKSNDLETPNVRLFSRPLSGKKRIEKSMSDLVEIMKSNNRMRSQISPLQQPAVQTSDDIDLFFLSLAKSVKKLPYNEQVRLKMGISILVFEAELRSIQAQVVAVTTPHPSSALSSVNTYSSDFETFVQSPSTHYFPHNNEPIPLLIFQKIIKQVPVLTR